MASIIAHELEEATTDPDPLSGWADSTGAENADKCAWTFGASPLKLGGSSRKIQGNSSNNAYDATRGYTDSTSGFVRGCIDGTN